MEPCGSRANVEQHVLGKEQVNISFEVTVSRPPARRLPEVVKTPALPRTGWQVAPSARSGGAPTSRCTSIGLFRTRRAILNLSNHKLQIALQSMARSSTKARRRGACETDNQPGRRRCRIGRDRIRRARAVSAQIQTGPPAVGVLEAVKRPITGSNEFLGRIEGVNRVAVVARVSLPFWRSGTSSKVRKATSVSAGAWSVRG